MVIYVGNQNGKSKTTGNPYYRYTLVEVSQDEKDGDKLQGRVYDFFAESEIDVSALQFGDVVKAEFETRSELSERKTLVGLRKISDSPYILL